MSYLFSVPPEVILEIIENLHGDDVYALFQSCRKFCVFLQNRTAFWNRISLREFCAVHEHHPTTCCDIQGIDRFRHFRNYLPNGPYRFKTNMGGDHEGFTMSFEYNGVITPQSDKIFIRKGNFPSQQPGTVGQPFLGEYQILSRTPKGIEFDGFLKFGYSEMDAVISYSKGTICPVTGELTARFEHGVWRAVPSLGAQP
eukprot:PhF_6_TR24492/c0_g1_i1/m.33857